MEPRDLDACVTGCARAHQRLLATLDGHLAAGTLQTEAPSQLPDWTVGHVLGHLIGNAQAFIGLFEAAARGEVGAMYPGGPGGRQADIERSATLPADALVSEIRRSIWALEGAWAACTADGWRGTATAFGTPFPMADVPLRRWREVEVHLSDLGMGVEPADWDAEYVQWDLPAFQDRWVQRHATDTGRLPDAALALAPWQRLAWLLGRVDLPGLPDGRAW